MSAKMYMEGKINYNYKLQLQLPSTQWHNITY